MSKDKPKGITFRDRNYVRRSIVMVDAKLMVEDSKITVVDPAHIKQLRTDPSFEELK